ncbi:hypothetical protein V2J09_008897 [Rumex salicifolius]
MSLFGGNIPVEAGLQLLLSPGASNIVLRTACCSVGIALPVYSTFKAIERDDADEKHRCLMYWAAYGSFSIAEIWADKILYWAPFYYHLKFAFLLWLQLPLADGSRQVYMNYLRPFFLRHQARIDSVVGTFYGEATRFVSSHQAEFQFAKRLIMNILAAAHQMVRGVLHPMAGPTRVNQAIEGADKQPEDSNSDSDSGSVKED